MAEMLKVEYDELIRRAKIIEEPLPPPPSVNPGAPCALDFVKTATTRLGLSADRIRFALGTCEREWGRLGQSLRNAAKAYEEIDAGFARALANTFTSSSTGSALVDEQMTILCDPDPWDLPPTAAPPPPAPPQPIEDPYRDLRKSVAEIEAPDQGTGLIGFAKEWENFQAKLDAATTERFLSFEHWEGLNATLVEQNFGYQRRYVGSVMRWCDEISVQARTIEAAHRLAVTDHPTAYWLSIRDYWRNYHTSRLPDPDQRRWLNEEIKRYLDGQQKSEKLLAEYAQQVRRLPAVIPEDPPSAVLIKPPPVKPDPDKDKDAPVFPDPPKPGIPGGPDGGPPSDDTDFPDLPDSSGSPSVPSTGTPSTPNDSKLADALKNAKKSAGLPTGAGVKAASVGGGGGVPSMPLQPAMDAEAAGRAGAGAGPGGAGRGVPGLGGAAGGGGMGGMPMGAPGAKGKGENDGKGKRVQGEEDDALYTEDRAWTEGVIGRRRAKDAPN